MQAGASARSNRLHRRFVVALDSLDAESREPDRWEEECLAYALGAMACGMELVAEVELDAFRRSVAERPAEVIASLEARPRRFSKAMLRQGLEYVRAQYGREGSADMPAVVAAGRRDFQSSIGAFAA